MLASEYILIDISLPDSYRVSSSLPAGRSQLNGRPNVPFGTVWNITELWNIPSAFYLYPDASGGTG